VDTLTESLIQQGMDNADEGVTSFVIAHRLSTIRNATRILVIEDGRIKEMGTHRELLKLGGHYHRLYTSSSARRWWARWTISPRCWSR
jgi:ABC-type multidrug transport system fused ATPase/permease subunit